MGLSKTKKEELIKLGDKLKQIRLAKGLTLRELGFKIDKDPQWISRIENGDTNPTYLTLMDLCSGLEIRIMQLFEK